MVTVAVDYVQQKTDSFPEKTCCTVKVGDVNIAEALVSKGLSKVVRYRADDESRSFEYDLLLSAESAAEKNKKGLFAGNDKKEVMRVQEVQNDQARSKQFLPLLQKSDGTRLFTLRKCCNHDLSDWKLLSNSSPVDLVLNYSFRSRLPSSTLSLAEFPVLVVLLRDSRLPTSPSAMKLPLSLAKC